MSNRKLVVVLPNLSEAHRGRIEAAARARGFDALFFKDVPDALPALREAEIAFGQSEALAQNAPKLRWLCTPSAGVDQFAPPGTFLSPDAVLTNSSGAYGVTISEHIVMVTLQLMRRQMEYAELLRDRVWRRDLPIRSIRDCRALLLGTGDIGRETALRLRAFGPKSLVGMNRSGRNPGGLFDRIIARDELDGELSKTDLVILSLPGTAEAARVLDARRLALLPDGALVVNVGRGGAIDQAALEAELRAGRLVAALDVFEREPLPQDDPLWACPNLLITSHTAGNMTLPYTVQRIVEMFLEDFDNYCEGRALAHRVDLKKGY